jgi:hypothetical protein
LDALSAIVAIFLDNYAPSSEPLRLGAGDHLKSGGMVLAMSRPLVTAGRNENPAVELFLTALRRLEELTVRTSQTNPNIVLVLMPDLDRE